MCALLRGPGEHTGQPVLRHHAGHPLAQQALRIPAERGLDHLFDAQVRQRGGDVVQKERVGRENHHLRRSDAAPVGIEQVGDAVQRDGGLAGARHALHNQGLKRPVPDDHILLGLNGGHHVAQPVSPRLAQHAHQIGVLRGHVGIKKWSPACHPRRPAGA